MSPETLPEVSPADQDFARLWAESTSQVLESIHASPFTATPRGPAAVETTPEASADSLWIRFRASGALEGELAFRFGRSDGVRSQFCKCANTFAMMPSIAHDLSTLTTPSR